MTVVCAQEDKQRYAREIASYVPPPDIAAAAATEPGTPDREWLVLRASMLMGDGGRFRSRCLG